MLKTGIHRQTYFRYERGRTDPPGEFLSKIVKEFPISTRWLLTGLAPMDLVFQEDEEIMQRAWGDPILRDIMIRLIDDQYGKMMVSVLLDKKSTFEKFLVSVRDYFKTRLKAEIEKKIKIAN